jgi:ubiquinone biosynthesis protein UbiJ
MDTRWTGPATGGGLLPQARRELGEIISAVGRLADETAWECATARDFRAELAVLHDQLETVRRTADALEDELRRLWQQTSVGVG